MILSNRYALAALLLVALGTQALAQGRLVAVDSSRALSEIDMLTGAKTPIGTVTANAGTTGGLTYHPSLDLTYLTSTSTDSLYTLDVATGTATLVGPYDATVPAIVMHGLEYHSGNGILFGASSHNGGLYAINNATGAATLIGLSGLTSFLNLAYNPDDGVMYATNSGTDSFYTINVNTGLATLVGPLTGPTNPNGLAYNTLNHTMYMVDNNTDTLYTINLANGAATAVGSTGTGNLLGLVFYAAVPEPSTYALIAVGLAGAWVATRRTNSNLEKRRRGI